MLPHLILGLAPFLSLLPSVAAHGILLKVDIDGTTYTANAPGAQPSDSVIRQVSSINPVKGATNPSLNCGLDAQLATKVAPANPGSLMKFYWGNPSGSKWVHNTGPLMFYMAKCDTTCDKFNGSNAGWFKISQLGKKQDDTWYQQDVMNGEPTWVTVPATLEAAEYLVRQEIISLQNAQTEGGAEFYVSCTQISVSGSQTGTPDKTVPFPGAYNDNDPGIFDTNIYEPNSVYIFPGPNISNLASPAGTTDQTNYSGSASPSGSGGASTAMTNGAYSTADGAYPMPSNGASPTTDGAYSTTDGASPTPTTDGAYSTTDGASPTPTTDGAYSTTDGTCPTPTTDGAYSTTDGASPTTNGASPTTNGASPTTDGASPTTDGASPTTDGASPTTDGAYSTTDGACPTPTTDGASPTTDGAYSTTDGAYSTTDGASPTTDGAYPTTDGAYSTTDGASPTTDGAYPTPTTDGASPTTDGAYPTPTTDGASPTTDGACPTTDGAPPTPTTDGAYATTTSGSGQACKLRKRNSASLAQRDTAIVHHKRRNRFMRNVDDAFYSV